MAIPAFVVVSGWSSSTSLENSGGVWSEVEWSPRSPDMTACDFFFRDYLKSQLFSTPPRDMQDLRNRIQVEFENLKQNPSVVRNAVRSMEKVHELVLKNMAGTLNKNWQKQSPINARQNSCSANM